MKSMPTVSSVNDETLTMMIARESLADRECKDKLMAILSVLLTAAKSRSMTLHALKDNAAMKPRETLDANVYELLKVATGNKPLTSKIIICIGKVNAMIDRIDVKKH